MSAPGVRTSYSTIPYQRNYGFFSREDQLHKVDEAFKHIFPPLAVRAVAIWGTWGIGKSQVALEYAHRRWNSGTSVVLWISSGTEREVAKSFREASEKLKLEGYSKTNNPDKNYHLVIQWLKTKKTKWLVIFDNVEDDKVLIGNDLETGYGDVLITCRSEELAKSIAPSPIEVTTFSTQEGTSFIFQVLSRKVFNSGERRAADSLVGRLGGLPLAIDIMAKNIKASRHFRDIGEFLPYYEKNCIALKERHRRIIRDVTYSKDFDTVGETIFVTINPEVNPDVNPDAVRLMEILCFVAPEAIPQSLFQGDKKDCPEKWHFLVDYERFEKAKLGLLSLSLIRINDETGLISIHRLLQQACFDQMTIESRQDAFNIAFSLLRKAFPNRRGETHLWNRWAVCERYHQHIHALNEMHTLMGSELVLDTHGFQMLICDDIWYMIELQQFVSAEALVKCQLLKIEAESLENAHMNRILMGLFERTGRSVRALDCAEVEFKFFDEYHGSEGNDLANACSDMGYSCCSAFQPKEALKYLNRAVDIALSHAKPDCYRVFNIDRFLRNRGRAKAQLRDLKGSLDDFTKAEHYQAEIHGENSHYDGETKHERAKIMAIQGRLKEAMALNQEAIELVRRGKPTHSSVGASHYQQGCVLLLGGRYDDAMQEFEKAHDICRENESTRGNAGESARIMWRVAQIYEHKNNLDKAQNFLSTAKEIRSNLLATGDYAHGKTEEDSWDCLVGLLYR
ncbi:P-loop containing nucleoside triphosphate hydrolase protein [Nemania abortiva]|nr:P-loop containing nucleoside triphosphate hydrolase protein [Nemania abortiva]